MLLVNSVPVTLTKRSFGAEAIDFVEASLHAVAQDRRNTPFTPAAHAYYALAEDVTLADMNRLLKCCAQGV
jgi:hypothetical protein